MNQGNAKSLGQRDIGLLIHSLHDAAAQSTARVWVEGEGAILRDAEGKEYIDALAGLWNVFVGHGRRELAEAAARQMEKLAYVSGYAGNSNVPAIELAERLSHLTYPNIERFYFTSGGAESNETAFKTARFYWKMVGRPEKTKIISRRLGYHGTTLAAMSATGMDWYWPMFEPRVPGFVHIESPYPYWFNASPTPHPHPSPPRGEGESVLPSPPRGEGESVLPSPLEGEGKGVLPSPLEGEGKGVLPSPLEGEGKGVLPSPLEGEGKGVLPSPLGGEGPGVRGRSLGIAAADLLEEAILREGPETVAAFIAEPVQGSGGVIVPPDDYFPRIRQICDRYDVLLIADEVITGFGRTGRWFGLEHWGIQPDIITFAKGITSGYVPLGGMGVSERIATTIRLGAGKTKWMQAFTYSGHPTACAVALANLDIIEREKLVERAAALGQRLITRLRSLEALPHVGETRGLGLMAAVELVENKQPKRRFDSALGIGPRVLAEMGNRGVITRIVGDVILLAPPLVTSEQQIDRIVDTVGEAILAVGG